MVIALEGGEAYGLGSSVPGFHLLNAIKSCKQLFTPFGGHSHAVGFSLPAERVPGCGLTSKPGPHCTSSRRHPACAAMRSCPSIKLPRLYLPGCAALSLWAMATKNRSSLRTTSAWQPPSAPSRTATSACSWPRARAEPVGRPWDGTGQPASRRLASSKARSFTLPTSSGKPSSGIRRPGTRRSRTWYACKLRACHEASSLPSRAWMDRAEAPAAPPERVAAEQWIKGDGDPPAGGNAGRRSHSRPAA